eukprot:CAMPEP_0197034192 /NCGR_PEP_ID=MMETSP1384-20130603/12372_1 /TAXON_ID=29189 /ORGANISM="Ammonia sp." /LENGTH=179 /DNA_ID=CAMNT_0042464087 /DNA_START=98 /DNA_END=634 /DNA_ORIENTATION=+
MEGSYYDIDDILAEGQVLPCTFNVDAVELGYLDETGDCGDDLRKGTTINLPYWLAKPLQERRMISIQQPKCYQSKVADALSADPKVVNLRAQCEYWYVLGYKLSKLKLDPLDASSNIPHPLSQVALWMEKALQVRHTEIIDQSHHFKTNNFDQFRAMLTYIEQKLFDQKHETEIYLHKW